MAPPFFLIADKNHFFPPIARSDLLVPKQVTVLVNSMVNFNYGSRILSGEVLFIDGELIYIYRCYLWG